ncbi:hypothetical protein D3C76_393380 [compost metagenome]
MKIPTLCLSVMALLASSGIHAMECKGLDEIRSKSNSAALQQLVKSVASNQDDVADCDSVATVMNKAARTDIEAGRKLEEDRPYNASQAQANFAQAQADPDVRQRLDQVGKEVSNRNLRLLYQAAILDEEGYYSARDMLVRQLRQQLK